MYKNVLAVLFVVGLIIIIGFPGIIPNPFRSQGDSKQAVVPEKENTSEAQKAEAPASHGSTNSISGLGNPISGSVKTHATKASGGNISSIGGIGSPISGSVRQIAIKDERLLPVPYYPDLVHQVTPDVEGAYLLEALCSHIGWSEEVHGVLFLYSRDELYSVKSALEARGWIFKEEKSPWPRAPFWAGSHQEKGYKIHMGYLKQSR